MPQFDDCDKPVEVLRVKYSPRIKLFIEKSRLYSGLFDPQKRCGGALLYQKQTFAEEGSCKQGVPPRLLYDPGGAIAPIGADEGVLLSKCTLNRTIKFLK